MYICSLLIKCSHLSRVITLLNLFGASARVIFVIKVTLRSAFVHACNSIHMEKLQQKSIGVQNVPT